MTENTPKPTGSRNWGAIIGGTFGWGLYAFGLVIWAVATPITAIEKFQSGAIPAGSELLIIALVAYAAVTAIGLAVINATFGSRHLATRIGLWLATVLLIGGVVVVIAQPAS
jgi:hypothetical protein